MPTNFSPSKTILLLAGETSGDTLGANLVLQLKKNKLPIEFMGMCGSQMRAAGVTQLINADEHGIVGISAIFGKLKELYCAFKTLKKYIKKTKPALVVLIDNPGFNLRMAKYAKQQGCKVLFYVSPQIWAWRYHRIKTIKKYVDHMAVLFPFEEKLYRTEKVSCSYVGHPLARKAYSDLSVTDARKKFGLNPNQQTIGLLPGSRHQEIEYILPTLIESTEVLLQQQPDLQFILLKANNLSLEKITQQLPKHITLTDHSIYDMIRACDVIIATSGTVTFEVALMQVPMVILYKTSKLTYWIGKRLVRIPYIGLCNVVAEKPMVKEFIQDAATTQAIANETLALLNDVTYRQQVLEDLQTMRAQLGNPPAAEKTADIALSLLDSA